MLPNVIKNVFSMRARLSVCRLSYTVTSSSSCSRHQFGCASQQFNRYYSSDGSSKKVDFSKMTDTDWKKKISPEQYVVCREGGTEPAFTGEYYTHKEAGLYNCACCGTSLFSSDTKYDSGSGWPSFYEPHKEESQVNIAEKPDTSHGKVRTEVVCKQCQAHLGHVFPDGPEPTGQRYCINSLSLKFKPKDK